MKFSPLIILSLIGMAAIAQDRGSLTGMVRSSEDHLPLVGANVQIQNTTLGASTKADGTFFISRIPSGSYTLIISLIGFQRKTSERITIEPDATLSMTVNLDPSPVQTEAVVVTANRRAQSLSEVPVSMSVLDAQMLEDRSIVAVGDALRYASGVNMVQTQINIRASSGYSRGVGSRVLLLLDGMPLLAGDTGETIFEAVPVFQIERIEIVKGAGSALYGSSALGGVVNVLTKPLPDLSQTRWRAYAGFHDDPPYDEWKWSDKPRYLHGLMISHAQRFGDIGILVAGSQVFDDGFRENDWLHRYSGFAKADINLSPYQSLTFSTNVMYHKRGDYFWWKDAQNALKPDLNQRDYQVTALRVNSMIQYKQYVSERFSYELKGVEFHGHWHEDSLEIERSTESLSDIFNGDFQGNYALSDQHLLTFGISGNFDQISAGDSTKSSIFGKHAGYGAALYLQDEFQIVPMVKLIGGLRHDFQKVDTLKESQQTNPKIALHVSLDKESSIRVSIGRGFRAPSIAEFFTSTSAGGLKIVPSTEIKPEHSWTYELGGTIALSPTILIDGAMYQSDFWDLIEAALDTSLAIKFQNITRARILGYEVAIQAQFLERSLSISAGYNYNYPYDLDQKTILRFRPRHVANLSLSYSYGFMTAGLDYRYVSRVEEIDYNLIRLAPIRDGDLRVPIKVADLRFIADFQHFNLPFRAIVNVRNALRYSYVELMGNLGPLRSYLLTLEGNLKRNDQ